MLDLGMFDSAIGLPSAINALPCRCFNSFCVAPEREKEEQRAAMLVSGTVAAVVCVGVAVVRVGVAVVRVGAAVVRVGCCLCRREALKAGDKEIAKERNREREIEKEKESYSVPAQVIIHFTHTHPLNQFRWSPKDVCNSCGTTGGLGWGYRCDVESCNFNLHKECAQMRAPATLPFSTPEMPVMAEAKAVRTFAHQPHPVSEMYGNSGYCCTHCNTGGYGWRYRCVKCNVDLHPVCTENPTRLSTFMHPKHELELKTKRHYKKCDLCGLHTTRTSHRVYRCKECKFYVHPACSQLPQYLQHRWHPHVLVLKLMSHSSPCDAPECKDRCKKWRYHCRPCNISIHIQCVLCNSVHGKSDKIKKTEVMIQALDIVGSIVQFAPTN